MARVLPAWEISQPRCPSTGEQIKRAGCIYTVEFYLAIKNEMMTFAGNIDGIGDRYFK